MCCKSVTDTRPVSHSDMSRRGAYAPWPPQLLLFRALLLGTLVLDATVRLCRHGRTCRGVVFLAVGVLDRLRLLVVDVAVDALVLVGHINVALVSPLVVHGLVTRPPETTDRAKMPRWPPPRRSDAQSCTQAPSRGLKWCERGPCVPWAAPILIATGTRDATAAARRWQVPRSTHNACGNTPSLPSVRATEAYRTPNMTAQSFLRKHGARPRQKKNRPTRGSVPLRCM